MYSGLLVFWTVGVSIFTVVAQLQLFAIASRVKRIVELLEREAQERTGGAR